MYIPLNKIITNLYTNGNEFALLTTGEEYIGNYWKDYQGKSYAGKTPNAYPQPILLIPFITSKTTPPQTTFTQNAAFPNEVWDSYEGPYSKTPSLQTYNTVKNIDIEPILTLPTQYYPYPTKDDYNLGVFTRYFTVRINQPIYLEVDKDSFDSLIAQKSTWYWQPYLAFSIPWTLTGEEKEVEQTNLGIILLQEKINQKLGLREFLKFNYLKFYQPNLES